MLFFTLIYIIFNHGTLYRSQTQDSQILKLYLKNIFKKEKGKI